MRVVLDTNVVVSALLWRGIPHQLLEELRRIDWIHLFASDPMIDELADILTRPAPSKQLKIIGRTAGEVLKEYLEITDIVFLLTVPSVIETDPDDDYVLAAAVEADADMLVSGDHHVLGLGNYQHITIVAPAGALAIIKARERT